MGAEPTNPVTAASLKLFVRAYRPVKVIASPALDSGHGIDNS